MYTLRLVTENGSTEIGGPLRTLGEALNQINTLIATIPGAKKMDDFEGATWSTGGGSIRILGILDQFGLPVSKKETESCF